MPPNRRLYIDLNRKYIHRDEGRTAGFAACPAATMNSESNTGSRDRGSRRAIARTLLSSAAPFLPAAPNPECANEYAWSAGGKTTLDAAFVVDRRCAARAIGRHNAMPPTEDRFCRFGAFASAAAVAGLERSFLGSL